MNRALLVIDVQESFRARPLWRLSSNPGIAGPVGTLVEHARAEDAPVFWVLHTEPGSGTVFDPELGHVRPIEGLRPRADEAVLTKTAHNAFTTTNLQQRLTVLGVREVTICGIRTEQCCETTARIAADLGYAVTFVTDATATDPIPHRAAPAGLSPEELLAHPGTLHTGEIIARTEYALAGRFATIRTVAELTGAGQAW
ncbi:nicotinamidase-related amidase [Prauserella shujinwangii]|uniref:Nicotinamidase-related amidase n=1 Tax=Prauserella shujinwangii TaxID=1453103 RepID=A0A2T0LQS6_9PSEU|nr:isochorismatase family protein [Prauserella shujinwangii]PRX45861.1 nicotinamidase-related amidase [Prauserella shujinwangii]